MTESSSFKQKTELLTFTYGALISRLFKDYNRAEDVNEQLFSMGLNIGSKLIDDFLAKSGITRCKSYKDTVDSISKIGFKNYLGVDCDVKTVNEKEFDLIFLDNPLNDFVEIPEEFSSLWYSNLITGIIQGALKEVRI